MYRPTVHPITGAMSTTHNVDTLDATVRIKVLRWFSGVELASSFDVTSLRSLLGTLIA